MTKQHSDFDLHGIVGIRLIGASQKEVSMIVRQLGPIEKELNREPDISIEFVEKLPINEAINLTSVDDAGFTSDSFLVMRSKHKSSAKVQIPFDDIGTKHCKIVAERDISAIPLLIAIINVIMITKDVLPLHASALDYQGKGILATGWAKGGKTETLLAFTARGGRYIGDEWIYLDQNNGFMYGIPEPIRLWSWHFDEMPEYRASLKRAEMLKLKSLGWVTHVLETMVNLRFVKKTLPMKLFRRINAVLKRQLYIQVPPKRLFGEQGLTPTGKPDKIFFVASHESSDFVVNAVDPSWVAERMVFSLQDERKDFLAYYTRFRFAFPDKVNPVIEDLEQTQRQLLLDVLKDKECYTVYHPYPLSIPKIYDVLAPFIG